VQGGAERLEVRALELMKPLRHPNLLTVSGYWQTDALLMIAVDLADGTLLDRLRACQRQGLPGIPLLRALNQFLQFRADPQPLQRPACVR
jgi:hypothetical protein